MTSFKQIEANRRNARDSSGPRTTEGKLRSRCNAVRHGLTAETVIGALEDAEDYQAFEATVTADYDAHSAVERELVLRLASLLWRLRRATTIETGLFEIQADHLRDFKQQVRSTLPATGYEIIHARFGRSDPMHSQSSGDGGQQEHLKRLEPCSNQGSTHDLAHCFLRLANLPSYPLDRLNRYEAVLWRQAAQTLLTLDALDRRKPQERRSVPALSFKVRHSSQF